MTKRFTVYMTKRFIKNVLYLVCSLRLPYYDPTTFYFDGMIQNAKIWLSLERNISFPYVKKNS